uniref:Protein MIS12 homolog n=1 Tax=Lotus japonicus TaxID=34305 RepID=I3S7A5_LOTJA|nr:unknown [Lotus japonicus]
MEGSESEAVLESLNLNPRLYLNEVLNTVDDVVQQAFNFFYQEASTHLNSETTQRSQNLKQGVDRVRQRVQSVLDTQLDVWEKYCLHHCFALPQGFTMPNTDESSKNDVDPGALFDPDVDAQLDSLRKKLAEVGKESEMLNQEVQALERQTTLNARYINEAVKSYEQNSSHELFQEIMTTASELGMKVKNLNPSLIKDTVAEHLFEYWCCCSRGLAHTN